MLPAVARLATRPLVFHAITTPEDAPLVLNVTQAYGIVRLYQDVARYNSLVEEHIIQWGFRTLHYTQRPGFYAALIRLVLPLIVTDQSVDTLVGLDADMEVGIDLSDIACWNTPQGLLRLACGTSAAHVARVKLWCRDTPRNCHPESYCFGGVVRCSVAKTRTASLLTITLAWWQVVLRRSTTLVELVRSAVRGMVADYGVFAYPLAEQTILNRMYAQQRTSSKQMVEPLSALYNCPRDHCTQVGVPSPPCSISHLRSHALELSLGLVGKHRAPEPLQALVALRRALFGRAHKRAKPVEVMAPPPCVDFARFNARKRHSSALLIGNGPSANAVKATHARLIERTWDVWATNAFFVHATLTPDFHHVEVKGYTEPFWLQNFDASVRARYRAHDTLLWGFKETKFFATSPRPSECRLNTLPKRNASHTARAARKAGHVCGSNCPRCLQRVLRHTRLSSYTYGDLAFGETTIDFGQCAAAPVLPNVLSKRCHASITTVLSMIIQLRYERLYILGVDLHSPLHFFDVKPKYAALRRPDLTREEKADLPQMAKAQKASQRKQHLTARSTVAFLPAFLSANALPAINLSPDSLLRSTSIPFVGLAEALNAGPKNGSQPWPWPRIFPHCTYTLGPLTYAQQGAVRR